MVEFVVYLKGDDRETLIRTLRRVKVRFALNLGISSLMASQHLAACALLKRAKANSTLKRYLNTPMKNCTWLRRPVKTESVLTTLLKSAL
ncbi:hypothetical protein O9992_03065 [Vibrio lentus]|nr:hypothetical protein [Vibrio lentus]